MEAAALRRLVHESVRHSDAGRPVRRASAFRAGEINLGAGECSELPLTACVASTARWRSRRVTVVQSRSIGTWPAALSSTT